MALYVERAVKQAESAGLNVAHICISHESSRREVLVQAGFPKVRTYLDMLWTCNDISKPNLPPSYFVRGFEDDDIPLLTSIQNDSFTGS